ncbi:hypothetical protein ACFFRR_003270 [Megaselia abdita]
MIFSFSFTLFRVNRNFKNIDDELPLRDISLINWSSLHLLPLDDCVSSLEKYINKLFDDHVPLVTRRIISSLKKLRDLELNEIQPSLFGNSKFIINTITFFVRNTLV